MSAETKEKGKRTPTPWKWDGKVWDYDAEQEAPWLVADDEHTNPPILSGEIRCRSQANAEFIVRAVNAHEALLEACKAIVGGFDYDPGHSDLDNEQPIHVSMSLGNYRRARAALALAEGRA